MTSDRTTYWNCVSIRLTQGRHTIIDAEDYEVIVKREWRFNNNGYAITARTATPKAMHHFLVTAPVGKTIDHRNRDRLDNRRANLRVCSEEENARNRRKRAGSASPYKGVSINNRDRVWQAKIWIDGKNVHLGNFKDDVAAAAAYNSAAMIHFGEFAVLNELP